MYSCSLQNKAGTTYVLNDDEAIYQVVSITGLNPPGAQINTTTIVGLDGAVFNSAKLQTRNIVLTIKINGQIESNRINLYKIFRTKEWCRFYYSNGTVDVWIDGYVETVECDMFSDAEMAQISIICPQPYFRSVDQMIADISSVTAGFEFPFSIEEDDPEIISSYDQDATATITNATATETGLIIELDFAGDVDEVIIQNNDTGEAITLEYSFLEDDRVVINTNPGEKSVKLTRNGVTTSIFSAVQLGSVFFQLAAGESSFSYSADEGDSNADVYVYFTYYYQYRGV